MPIEQEFVTPFGEWLLGPGWQDGALFAPWFLVVAVILAVALSAWLLSVLRGESARPVQRLSRTLIIGLLSIALLSGIALMLFTTGVWLVRQGSDSLIAPVERAHALRQDVVAGIGGFLGEGWLAGALYQWLLAMGVLLVIGIVLSFLATLVRGGLRRAVRAVDEGVAALLVDFAQTSTRLYALAWLTVKESIRRKIVIVFAVFLIIVAFAGWFLDPGSDNPARLYLNFLLTWTTYLVLVLVLFLSTLSLPADIRNRTIHTVVTKPVRISEIVFGRMLGFTVVGTGLLLGMGAISYVFVIRGLAHTHELTEGAKEQLDKYWKALDADPRTLNATVQTKTVQRHHHAVHADVNPKAETVDEKGVRHGYLKVESENGHTHELAYSRSPDGEATYTISGPRGQLQARVPIYGKLRFKTREGKDSDKGINVGDEWEYRGFIEGGTLSAAVWTFENLREEDFPEGLLVEMTLGVFRTYKGEITKTIPGSLTVRNPETGDEVVAVYFASKEFETQGHTLPRTIVAPNGQKYDLFKDLVDEKGRLQIVLNCVAPHQFFGAGQGDLYIRQDSGWFFVNLLKGYLGVWMQMVLIIGFGVMYSTFLSGPIAWLATLGTLVGGLYSDFLNRLASHAVYGGGPFEAMYRLVTQMNVTSPLPSTPQTVVITMLDTVAEKWMGLVWYTLPDFSHLSYSNFVAYGFNVSGDVLGRGLLQVASFVVPLVVLGYVFLRSRELAQ